MMIITQPDGKKYAKMDESTIWLEWFRGGWRIIPKDHYESLKASGMMWELFPEAPLNWPLNNFTEGSPGGGIRS